MKLSLGEIAAILGASCEVRERVAEGYSIDSRTILPGQLFFAIRGPRFDAHEFVEQAIGRGAVGAVVERGFSQQAGGVNRGAMLLVRDTTEALQLLGRAVRRKWGRRVIAVTGSTGKTTTKELVAALVAKRFSVLKSQGNLNNQYGLPLTLLDLGPHHEVAVVELAMSAPGEIARLARIAQPQVGVVTNVAPVHLEFFDSVDAIAKAKRELIENLEPPAVAVLNYDDARVRKFGQGFAGRVVSFGFGEGAEFRASSFRCPAGTTSRTPSRHLPPPAFSISPRPSFGRPSRLFKIYISVMKFLHCPAMLRSSTTATTPTLWPWNACWKRLRPGPVRAGALSSPERCWSWVLPLRIGTGGSGARPQSAVLAGS